MGAVQFKILDLTSLQLAHCEKILDFPSCWNSTFPTKNSLNINILCCSIRTESCSKFLILDLSCTDPHPRGISESVAPFPHVKILALFGLISFVLRILPPLRIKIVVRGVIRLLIHLFSITLINWQKLKYSYCQKSMETRFENFVQNSCQSLVTRL